MLEVLHQNLHVQGFTSDGENMYWSFTDSVVKTNMNNTVLGQVPVFDGHLGDIDYFEGKLYASFMKHPENFSWKTPRWANFDIYVYDAKTLALEKKIILKDCYEMNKEPEKHDGFAGIDGVALKRGENGEAELWVAAGLLEAPEYNKQQLMRFDLDGNLMEIKKFPSGNAIFGIQNLDYEEGTGYFWYSTYGGQHDYQPKEQLFAVNPCDESVVHACDIWSPYGFHACGDKKYLISYQCGVNGNREGYGTEAALDTLLAGDDLYRRKGERP